MAHIIAIFSPLLAQTGAEPQYLDPGSGSIILQVLAAALLGGLYAVKVYWKKIKQLFNRSNPAATDGEDKKPDEG